MRDRMPFDQSQFQNGDNVLGLNGDKIGSVSNVGPNYLHVSTGFLGLGQDLFIPFDAITRVDNHDIYLDVTKDEVNNRGWDNRPAETMASNAGVLSGTMPAAGATAPTAPTFGQMNPATATPAPTYGTSNPAAIPGGVGRPTPSTWVGPQEVMGKTLVDIDGREIGNISNIGSNFFEVPTGLLNLGPTLFVPFTAISHCTRSKCFLNMPVGEIESMHWNQRPTEGMVGRGAAPGTPMPSQPTTSQPMPPRAPAGATNELAGAEMGQVMRIPVYEEELEVNRQRQQVGEVVVTKNVREEQRTIEVPVTHEEVVVERRAVDRDVPVGQDAFAEGQREIRVPVYEERVEVEKRPRVVEEVVVQPERVTEERPFTETVRREVVDVERTGDVNVSRGTGAVDRGVGAGSVRPWNEVAPMYQREWQRQYGTTGNWQTSEPAYRFGYENYSNPRFRGQSFQQAEPELRRQWEQTHPGNAPANAWDRVKADVSHAWHDVTGH